MADFKIPDFLAHRSVEEVHRAMLSLLPEDIDTSEGQHVFNLTRPTALEISKMCEFILPEVIKLIFPDTSYGQYLDDHAKYRGIIRKPATNATGNLLVNGSPGVNIPSGSQFSTAAVDDISSVFYVSTKTVTIPEEGSVLIPIRSVEKGAVGNTKAHTILLKASKISGITAVTNPENVSGGSEEERDESLIARISDYDKSQGTSFVGNVADYKRWASSVPGTGVATVIPAQDESGQITIVLTDSNGSPASESLCQEVYTYIMRPDVPQERIAPPNADLLVVPPITIQITISAAIELKATSTIEAVKEEFLKSAALYLQAAGEDREIKYTRVASLLSTVSGVSDFWDLRINDETKNIPILVNELAVLNKENISFRIEST